MVWKRKQDLRLSLALNSRNPLSLDNGLEGWYNVDRKLRYYVAIRFRWTMVWKEYVGTASVILFLCRNPLSLDNGLEVFDEQITYEKYLQSQSAFAGQWFGSSICCCSRYVLKVSQSAFAGQWFGSYDYWGLDVDSVSVAIRFRWTMVWKQSQVSLSENSGLRSQSAFAGQWFGRH